MSGMDANLSIGDFSRMTFVSVKALRHYHEIGLLAPAWVDPGQRLPALLGGAGAGRAGDPAAARPRHGARRHRHGRHARRTWARATRRSARTCAGWRTSWSRRARPSRRCGRCSSAARPRSRSSTGACRGRRRSRSATRSAATTCTRGWTTAFGELRAALDALGLRRAGADGALFSSELLEEERGELVAFVPVAEARARPRARAGPAGDRVRDRRPRRVVRGSRPDVRRARRRGGGARDRRAGPDPRELRRRRGRHGRPGRSTAPRSAGPSSRPSDERHRRCADRAGGRRRGAGDGDAVGLGVRRDPRRGPRRSRPARSRSAGCW